MIPRKPTPKHTSAWKKLFAESYVGIKELTQFEALNIDQEHLASIDRLFPIQLDRRLLKNHALTGPVLHQYLPSALELINPPGYSGNPVGDIEATAQPGIIKKYAHRALLITGHTCPIHCRYCFRKDFPYAGSNASKHRFENALKFCARDHTLHEVILSGGDPLSLEDAMLEHLFTRLQSIAHIKTIRLHTKFPSIMPERITEKLLAILTQCDLNKVCVFHINHPDEISQAFRDAVAKIKNTDTTTLNQAVLLKNINNSADVLVRLSHELFDAGVLPYYLHLLDRARGTHHFNVPADEAKKIISAVKRRLPGYLVPKLARETAGLGSKAY